jgi:flagella basal body P-ring formation protein FlgA
MRQSMRGLLIFAMLLCACFGLPSAAATLRTTTSLSAPVVLVSDLFDEAGIAASRVLGPAPPLGEHIVVEAAQLAAIARQFGVEWRPSSSADRVVLERPGRMLTHALVQAGAPALNEIELAGYEPPLVPLSSVPQVAVEQLAYQRESGRFAADVLVSGEAMAPLRLRVSGAIDEIAVIPVPAQRLAAGSVLRATDLVLAPVHVATLRGEVVRGLARAEGMALRRAVAAGQPLPVADLERPDAVTKGAHVTLELRSPGLTLAAVGVALEPGALGARVRILNPNSHAIVEGEVVGPQQVAVAPGAAPLAAEARLTADLDGAQ